MSESDAWWVGAYEHRCPTCQDRDVVQRRIRETEQADGLVLRWAHAETVDEANRLSAAARYTVEGATRRMMLDRGEDPGPPPD